MWATWRVDAPRGGSHPEACPSGAPATRHFHSPSPADRDEPRSYRPTASARPRPLTCAASTAATPNQLDRCRGPGQDSGGRSLGDAAAAPARGIRPMPAWASGSRCAPVWSNRPADQQALDQAVVAIHELAQLAHGRAQILLAGTLVAQRDVDQRDVDQRVLGRQRGAQLAGDLGHEPALAVERRLYQTGWSR
jgi:hypothetical protein